MTSKSKTNTNTNTNTNSKATLPTYSLQAQDLPEMASWPKSVHLFEAKHILALRAAEATGRPLLVCGEAGTGKSQLAHAAAAFTGRAFLPLVVGSHTEAQDLHWKFDAIARLADAHTSASVLGPIGEEELVRLHLRHYVQPGMLWWAMNWASALAQQQQCHHGASARPETPPEWQPQKGAVLLIDEIDKAEPDFPNGLLEALANRAFDIPLLGCTVKQDLACPPPLIIITSNDERELPAPFLRRCLVLKIELPHGEAGLPAWLLARGRLHFPDLAETTLSEAARLLLLDRAAAREQQGYVPGLAEYLDLLRALNELGADGLAQLDTLKQFYFDKRTALS